MYFETYYLSFTGGRYVHHLCKVCKSIYELWKNYKYHDYINERTAKSQFETYSPQNSKEKF